MSKKSTLAPTLVDDILDSTKPATTEVTKVITGETGKVRFIKAYNTGEKIVLNDGTIIELEKETINGRQIFKQEFFVSPEVAEKVREVADQFNIVAG